MNWPGGHACIPDCMMQMPAWNGPPGTGMQVSLLPQPVPGVAPPHAWPVAPQVGGILVGILALGVHELPETVASPTDAETLHGLDPDVQFMVPICGPQVVPPNSSN